MLSAWHIVGTKYLFSLILYFTCLLPSFSYQPSKVEGYFHFIDKKIEVLED